MKIESIFSTRRRLHLLISGDIDECTKFLGKITRIPGHITANMNIKYVDGQDPECSIICKSSNQKKFKEDVYKLIKNYEE